MGVFQTCDVFFCAISFDFFALPPCSRLLSQLRPSPTHDTILGLSSAPVPQ